MLYVQSICKLNIHYIKSSAFMFYFEYIPHLVDQLDRSIWELFVLISGQFFEPLIRVEIPEDLY